MKILILVITITWSFGGGYQNTPRVELVGSAEDAAIFIHNDRPSAWEVEPDHKEYKLYMVDFEKRSVNEVPIPKIVFQESKQPGKKN